MGDEWNVEYIYGGDVKCIHIVVREPDGKRQLGKPKDS